MKNVFDLPEGLQERLRAELKPGEAITWVGQPNPDRYMKYGLGRWIFFIPWTVFSLYWIAAASGFRVPEFDSPMSLFPLFGLPFLLIGIGGLTAPLRARGRARSIVYAITNQRAITIEGAKVIVVKSYLASEIAGVERTEYQDGSGHLILRTEQHRDTDGDHQTRQHGFFAVDDVRRVEGLVANLARVNVEQSIVPAR